MMEKFLNGLLFQLKVYQSTGHSFQKLFSDVMALSKSGFRRVRSYGRSGDGGNDGYIPSEGRYYQVYGPEYNGNSDKVISYAKKKLREDFNKISKNLGKPLRYHFVYNDYFKGAPKELLDSLDSLKSDEGLMEASVITSDDLQRCFLALDFDSKSLIVNAFPLNYVPSNEEVDSGAIALLIQNIAARYNTFSIMEIDGTAPDFAQKIRINNLNDAIRDTLNYHARFANLAEDFLDTRPGLAQDIALEMQELYAKSVEFLNSDVEGYPNLRFMWIAEHLLTDYVASPKIEPALLQLQRTASFVIMAKYFESCDIYEHPERAVAP